jgi:signal peptide peptidase SppA
VIIAALTERLGITRIDGASAWYDDDDDSFTRRGRNADTGYDLVDGIAIISVQGTLVQKLGTLRPWSGMTGYDGIRQSFITAINDPEVKGICLDIDSPGGEVAGCFDLADEIYAARGVKPIRAILSESAYSAAYAIASAADHISVPRTGGVGSIGVILMHVDWSQKLEKDGVKVTIVTFGDRKGETSPMIPLSDQARDGLQAEIDEIGALFVNTVARNRGISADTVRNTQAAVYLAAEGVSLGLADVVTPPDAAFRDFLNLIKD